MDEIPVEYKVTTQGDKSNVDALYQVSVMANKRFYEEMLFPLEYAYLPANLRLYLTDAPKRT